MNCTEKLSSCVKTDELIELVNKSITPMIGSLGGRKFVFSEDKSTVCLNDFVRSLSRLQDTSSANPIEIVKRIRSLDEAGDQLLNQQGLLSRLLTAIRSWIGAIILYIRTGATRASSLEKKALSSLTDQSIEKNKEKTKPNTVSSKGNFDAFGKSYLESFKPAFTACKDDIQRWKLGLELVKTTTVTVDELCQFLENLEWGSSKEKLIRSLLGSALLQTGALKVVACHNDRLGYMGLVGYNSASLNFEKIYGKGDFFEKPPKVSPLLMEAIGMKLIQSGKKFINLAKTDPNYKLGVDITIEQTPTCHFAPDLIRPLLPYIARVPGLISLKIRDIGTPIVKELQHRFRPAILQILRDEFHYIKEGDLKNDPTKFKELVDVIVDQTYIDATNLAKFLNGFSWPSEKLKTQDFPETIRSLLLKTEAIRSPNPSSDAKEQVIEIDLLKIFGEHNNQFWSSIEDGKSPIKDAVRAILFEQVNRHFKKGSNKNIVIRFLPHEKCSYYPSMFKDLNLTEPKSDWIFSVEVEEEIKSIVPKGFGDEDIQAFKKIVEAHPYLFEMDINIQGMSKEKLKENGLPFDKKGKYKYVPASIEEYKKNIVDSLISLKKSD